MPWPLAMAEGAMTRTAKSNLLPLLEGAVPLVEQPPSDAVNIVDGMAMQQVFKRDRLQRLENLQSSSFAACCSTR